MGEGVADRIVAGLMERAIAPGGFASGKGGPFDVASTVWVTLALRGLQAHAATVAACQDRLVACQRPDGRLPAFEGEPTVFWPTSLLVWILVGSRRHADARARAVVFLEQTAGLHWERDRSGIVGHDTSLRGWPWVDATHSWVEPTAYALLALVVTGSRQQPRVVEAVAMLLDRQLPNGGWNYGNTTVFNHVLDPAPDSTGHALAALLGLTERQRVEASLRYLAAETARLRTPLSLAWGLLGLSSWGLRPAGCEAWIDESLRLQDRYGPYDTTLLAQLALAARVERGIAEWVGGKTA